nr:transporter associated domain-containing protein [Bacillus subtilis]
MLIDQVNDLLGIHLENEEVDTIGGWFLTQKYDVEKDDSIIEEGCEFIINEIDDHHVAYIEVKKLQEEELLETTNQQEA